MIKDILYARYQLTDLDRMHEFMADFGLSLVFKDKNVLRMRASQTQPWAYEASLGPVNRFLGLGFAVDSMAELERLSALPGSSAIQNFAAGENDRFVRMLMDDGFEIDAVWVADQSQSLGVRDAFAFNNGQRKARINSSVRQRAEAAPALRMGHAVLHVTDHEKSVAWVKERLGLIASDYFGPPTNDPRDAMGTFMRVDHGDALVDHHCLLVLESEHVGIHHISFEMQDLDHVMAAHDHLVARGWHLDCGVGRHLLGSQIYDYWRDPAGFRVEHYTDGDTVNHQHEATIFSGTADETTQWGMAPSKEFFS